MSVQLPKSVVRRPVDVTVPGIAASRITSFRVDVLDSFDGLKIRNLAGVAPGGTLQWKSSAAIKSSGKLTLADLGQDIDFLNDRFKVTVTTADDRRKEVETELGVFLVASRTSQWNKRIRNWNIELLDKLSILDSDIMTDVYGNPVMYSVSPSDNLIEKVQSIIADSGESAGYIEEDSSAYPVDDMAWDMGVSRLQIVNEMLEAADYLSLWADGAGRFRVSKHEDPELAAVVYEVEAPFEEGQESMLAPNWSNDHDTQRVPNRMACIQKSTGADDDAEIYVATNRDLLSPFSYDNRNGRWITEFEDNVDTTGAASIKSYAKRKLQAATEVASAVRVRHAYLSRVMLNRVVRLSAGDVDGVRMIVRGTQLTLQAGKLVETDLRQVVTSVGDE